MYKLLNYSPSPSDGTSVLRSWGVLPRLTENQNLEILKAHGTISWDGIMNVDAVFLQRAFTPEQVQLAGMAKTYKRPIWCDWDDALWCVPKDNPSHGIYNQAASKQNMESCARMANVITVTTESLKERFHAFNDHVEVVPNAVDFDLITPMSVDLPRNPVICWRGGHSHVRDLHTHQDAILEAYERFPNFSFAFFGFNPWWITEKMDPARCRVMPFDSSYPIFMNNIMKMRSAIHIVPLHDSEFNRCKSNLSYLEGTVAGSVVLAPDFEEWRNLGAITYTDANGFRSQLFELMSTKSDDLDKIANKNLEFIKAYKSLKEINKLRLSVMKKFLGFTPS